MNKIILIGNVTADPTIKVTSTGKKLASFSMAINDGKDANGQDLTSYFNCKAWDKLADIIEKYVKKGHKIMASGKLKNSSWDKPDGTKAYATEISVLEIEMLTSKNQSLPLDKEKDFVDDDPLPEINMEDLKSTMPF